MQYILNGPDIPDRLIQAHEDGKVVFFCGAGISMKAELPNFKGLVNDLREAINLVNFQELDVAIERGELDRAINLMEQEYVRGRYGLRKHVASILSPNLEAPQATQTHESLLALAQSKDGRHRLVTTNCDRIFESVVQDLTENMIVNRHRAPHLPVPTKNQWDSLVYLHGLLESDGNSEHSEINLNDIVLSSQDFGNAYLKDRWAARFVSELFRNYTVCFVGYSIDDPILRYMVDAADSGDPSPERFALCSYKDAEEDKVKNQWFAKNVTPITYFEGIDHNSLHRTLFEWATIYRHRIHGKQEIIRKYGHTALSKPAGDPERELQIQQVLWALKDPSGLPAKVFADMEPVLPFNWLMELDEMRYGTNDLQLFQVPRDGFEENQKWFSMLRRPASSCRSPIESPVYHADSFGNKSDKISFQLFKWLVRHAHEPELVLWMAEQGGQLHRSFARLIQKEIGSQLHPGKGAGESRLSDIRTYWRLLLSRRVKSHRDKRPFAHWVIQLNQTGLTPSLRIDLLDMLAPCVVLKDGFPRPALNDSNGKASKDISDLIHHTIELGMQNPKSFMQKMGQSERWREALPELLPDLTQLLKTVFDLKAELGKVSAKRDYPESVGVI